jgi:prolyl-tRNA editing enzyme YbaK/EbsC (Cys-tRNA(Pro) deacylase)
MNLKSILSHHKIQKFAKKIEDFEDNMIKDKHNAYVTYTQRKIQLNKLKKSFNNLKAEFYKNENNQPD